MADERVGMIEEEGENSPVPIRRRMYKCRYCDRSFPTSQALGGHQNGHRGEREAVRKAQRDADLFGAQPAAATPPPRPSSLPQFFSSRLTPITYVQSRGSYLPPYYYPSASASVSIRNQLRYHPYNFSQRYASQAFDKLFATASSSAAARPPPPHPFAHGSGMDWSGRVSVPRRISIYDMHLGARSRVAGADARRETKPDGDGEIDLTLRL